MAGRDLRLGGGGGGAPFSEGGGCVQMGGINGFREIPSWSLRATLPEGESITEGFYINTIASPMSCE